MAGSYKVPTITIAVTVIIFACLHLMRTCNEMSGAYGYGDCAHHLKNPATTPAARRVEDMMSAENGNAAHENDGFPEKIPEKYNRVGRIVSIVVDVISILTGMFIYAAVNDDTRRNVQRRHFILPFIVWHSFCAFMLVVGLFFSMIVYRAHLGAIAMRLLLTASFILITILCIIMVLKYYLSLARESINSYAQMEDVNEVKKPLA